MAPFLLQAPVTGPLVITCGFLHEGQIGNGGDNTRGKTPKQVLVTKLSSSKLRRPLTTLAERSRHQGKLDYVASDQVLRKEGALLDVIGMSTGASKKARVFDAPMAGLIEKIARLKRTFYQETP